MKTYYNDPKIWHNLKDKARENRNNPTFAENIVWNILRKNNLKVKFRRQHIIYLYIVDFVCLDIGLIIEIDGNSHLDKFDYDKARTIFLESIGFKVVRFSNETVIEKGNLVESQISNIIEDLMKGDPTLTLPTT